MSVARSCGAILALHSKQNLLRSYHLNSSGAVELWQTEAFRRWWDEDWSWEGLSRKPASESSDNSSLQSLWKGGANNLFEFGGRTWTRFHLPPFDSSGNPCSEPTWNEAKGQEFGQFFENVRKNSINFHRHPDATERDGWRSNLRGVVFPWSFTFRGDILAADLQSTIFSGPTKFPKYVYASFRGAFFSGDVDFEDTQFHSDVTFDEAVFVGLANFSKSGFYGATNFHGSRFEKISNFDAAIFHRPVEFIGADFHDTQFNLVQFHSTTVFTGSNFQKASFHKTKFADKAKFNQTIISNVNFQNARFAEDFNLNDAICRAEMGLLGCEFVGPATFRKTAFGDSTKFSETIFRQLADFSGSTFSGTIDAYGAQFLQRALFPRSRMGSLASFRGASLQDADFSLALFHRADFMGATGSLNFRGATFAGAVTFIEARFQQVQFTNVHFGGVVSFRSVKIAGDAVFDNAFFEDNVSLSRIEFAQSASFVGVRFEEVADFSNASFKDTTSFRSATFVGVPRFEATILHADTTFVDSHFHQGPARLESLPTATDGLGAYYFRELKSARDDETRRYEHSYKVLKHLCAAINNSDDEARFHALELRQHAARSNAELADRLASLVYGGLSNYGRSMVRPVVFLVVAWAVLIGIYVLLFMPPYHVTVSGLDCGAAQTEMSVPSEHFTSVIVAVGRQFLPGLFSSGSGAATPPAWLRCAAESRPLAFFMVTVVQSLFFILCVALFLIALRRRFRIRQ